MSWKAIGDRIVVRKHEAKEEVSSGGLILIEGLATTLDKTAKATVVSVGSGRKEDGTTVPIELAVGDVILYHRHYGNDISGLLPTDDDKDLMVLSVEDVLAVVPG